MRNVEVLPLFVSQGYQANGSRFELAYVRHAAYLSQKPRSTGVTRTGSAGAAARPAKVVTSS